MCGKHPIQAGDEITDMILSIQSETANAMNNMQTKREQDRSGRHSGKPAGAVSRVPV